MIRFVWNLQLGESSKEWHGWNVSNEQLTSRRLTSGARQDANNRNIAVITEDNGRGAWRRRLGAGHCHDTRRRQSAQCRTWSLITPIAAAIYWQENKNKRNRMHDGILLSFCLW
jgi:hypothetical protein